MAKGLVAEVRAAFNKLEHPPNRQQIKTEYGLKDTLLNRLFSDDRDFEPRGENSDRLKELLRDLRALVHAESGQSKMVMVYDGTMRDGGDASLNIVGLEQMGGWTGNCQRRGKKIRDDAYTGVFEKGEIAVFEESPWEDGELVYATRDGTDEDFIGFATGTEDQFTIAPVVAGGAFVSSSDGWSIWGVAKGTILANTFWRRETHFTVRITRATVPLLPKRNGAEQ